MTKDNMEEEVGQVNKSKNYVKIFTILIFILVLILVFIIILGIVKAQSQERKINSVSEELRKKSLETLNNALKMREKANNLDSWNYSENFIEIQNKIQENKKEVQTWFDKLKNEGYFELYLQDTVFICSDGSYDNYKPGRLHNCSDGLIVRTEDRGYKNFDINGSTAFYYLLSSSLTITISEYLVDSLDNNKYELEKKLVEINSELKKEAEGKSPEELSAKKIESEELKKKIGEIKGNSGGAIAQILDQLHYTIIKAKVSEALFNLLNKNTVILEKDSRGSLDTINIFSQVLSSPNKQDINSLELKKECIEQFENSPSFVNTVETSELRSSIEDICGNLEKYQKNNAIEMSNRLEGESNPFIIIENKVYLNLLVKCGDKWFSELGGIESCIDNYLEDLNSKLNSL